MDGDADEGHVTPRWVKVSVVLALLAGAAFVVLHLTGNGFGGHGP